MKRSFLIVGLALATTFTYAQKKEIKKAEKAIKSEKYTDAINYLKEAEGSIGTVDKAMQAQFYALRGQALTGSAGANYDKAKAAAEAFERAFELDPNLRKENEDFLFNLRSIFINAAVRDQNAENFQQAAEKLKLSYKISQDPSDLYFAAGNYVNGKKLNDALEVYQQLLDMNYTGETTEFVATNKATGEVEPFDNENLRNIAVRSGEYIKPESRKTSSRKGEILRNMTLIYIQEGKNDQAKKVIASARAENPNDIYLMRAEADMSYNMGDMKRYNELMNEIAASDPENPEIHFNLGVASAELGEKDKAEAFYKKALELRPDYEAALINMAVLKLSNEGPVVEAMNKLGNSRADNQRYDELRNDLDKIRQDALPYLEKALKINPNNAQVTRTMMNIYSQIGEDAKAKALKTKLETLEKK